MKRVSNLCLIAVCFLAFSGCSSPSDHETYLGGPPRPATASVVKDRVLSYRRTPPSFLEKEPDQMCQVARDYLTLSQEAFGRRYTPDELWQAGAFDRLLFTERASGQIIAGISIGDTEKRVRERLGTPQFQTLKNGTGNGSGAFRRYRLIGYKTPSYYFAFEIGQGGNDDGLVSSVCLRKRYPMPEDRRDMLPVLYQYEPWYRAIQDDRWNLYFEGEAPITYTQWETDTRTMICDYGFVCTSSMNQNADRYTVYKDYEGRIPDLPEEVLKGTDGTYDPVTIAAVDYPEQMIYNIYSYLAQVDDIMDLGTAAVSPSGTICAYSADSGDLLDMTAGSLPESAHVVIHWTDGARPDQHVRFGHYSKVVGFPSDRYLIESDMYGLHVYDLSKDSIVYEETGLQAGRTDLRLDDGGSQILDGNGEAWYSYSFDPAGTIQIRMLKS